MKQKNNGKKITLLAVLALAVGFVISGEEPLPKKASADISTITTPATPGSEFAPATEAETRSPQRRIKAMNPTLQADQPTRESREQALAANSAPYGDRSGEKNCTSSTGLGLSEAFLALEADYWNEALDDRWTADFETELLDALEQRDVNNTSLDMVRCHSSICLVEFFHDTLKAREVMLHHLGSIRPTFGGFMVKSENSGSDIRTLVYFARPGETLPLPSNLPTSV